MKATSIYAGSLLFALAMPMVANAQSNVDHVTSRGYTQTTYFSAPATSAMFMVSQQTRVNGGQETEFFATGSASRFLPGGRLVVIVSDTGDAAGAVNPSSKSLKTPGSAWAVIPARRMEYQLGLGGIQLVSVTSGAMSAWSTLENVTSIEGTRDVDQNHLTIPGLGLIFAVHGTYSGKLGFGPTGVGGFVFTADSGDIENYFSDGSNVDPASWLGWLRSSETTIVHN